MNNTKVIKCPHCGCNISLDLRDQYVNCYECGGAIVVKTGNKF